MIKLGLDYLTSSTAYVFKICTSDKILYRLFGKVPGIGDRKQEFACVSQWLEYNAWPFFTTKVMNLRFVTVNLCPVFVSSLTDCDNVRQPSCLAAQIAQ